MGKNRVSYILAFLLFALVTGAPNFAHAADQTQIIVDCKKALQQNAIKAAQERSAAAGNYITGIPPLDSGLECINLIQTLLSFNGKINDLFGLLNFNFLIDLLVQQLASLVLQGCAAVLSAVQQAIASGLSYINNLICLPLPDIGLGGFSLSLPRRACNGLNVSPFQVRQTPGGPGGLNLQPSPWLTPFSGFGRQP